MVAHACNHAFWEAGTAGAWVSGQAGLQGNTLFQRHKERKKEIQDYSKFYAT